MNKIIAYARLLRFPGLGGLAIPPVIGAITVGMYDITNLAILFLIGAISAIYGFILNDFADVDIDRLSSELHVKPLVSGDISTKTALMICVFFILLAFLSVFILWYGESFDSLKLAALMCIFGAGVLGSFYDFYGKQFVGSDVLVAISMAFIFLFGALSFGEPTSVTWVIFVLTFNNLFHMNAVEGGIKDADHDWKLGVKNIALSTGVKVTGTDMVIPRSFQTLGMGIRCVSIFLVFSPFIVFGYSFYLWQLVILTIVSLGVLYFNIKLLSIKTFERNMIRRYIAVQSFLRYALVPLMLIPIAGTIPSLVLLFLPIVWYIVFAPLFGEKFLRPRM